MNGEVANILELLAAKVRRGGCDNTTGRTRYVTLHDMNGNSVGAATYDRTGESGYPREALPKTHWRYSR